MVPTTISRSSKTPPLSYAERAKKAQTIRPSVCVPPSRIANTSTSLASSSSTASNLSTLAPVEFPAIGSIPSTSADGTPNSSVTVGTRLLSNPSAATSSATPSVPTNDEVGSSTESTRNLPAANLSYNKPPVANFWNVRKEQMAASRPVAVSSSITPPVAGCSAAKNQPISTNIVEMETNHSARSIPSIQIPSGIRSQTSSKSNSSISEPTIGDRSSKQPYALPVGAPSASISPIADSEAWPEVGKPLALGQNLGTSSVQSSSNAVKGYTSSEGMHSISRGSKKNEKTKWVPIPAEELQIAADALLSKSSRPHSRRTSKTRQHISPGQHNTNNSTLNSASQSTSHSRVQSRSESLQSSPRLPRGRRLPGDEVNNPKTNGIHAPPSKTVPSSAETQPSSSSSSRPSQTPSLSPYPSALPIPNHSRGSYPAALPLPVHSPMSHPIPSTTDVTTLLSSAPINTSQNGSPSAHPLQIPAGAYVGAVPPYPIYPTHGSPYHVPDSMATQLQYWNVHMQTRSGQCSPSYPPAVAQPSLTEYNPTIPIHPPHAFSQVNGYMTLNVLQVPTNALETTTQLPVGNLEATPAHPTTKPVIKSDKPVVFGSINLQDSVITPSPPEVDDLESRTEAIDTSFAKFSIGISPDELPGRRSRTRSNKNRSSPGTVSDPPTILKDKVTVNGASSNHLENSLVNHSETEGARWEFGTTNSLAVLTADDPIAIHGARLSPMSGSVSPTQLPLDPVLPAADPPQTLPKSKADIDPEFQVKDYGYGFGQAGGSGNAAQAVREEKLREWEEEKLAKQQRLGQQHGRGVSDAPTEDIAFPQSNTPTRARRPFNGSYGFERGAYYGRRGRGLANGHGGGYARGHGRPHQSRGTGFQVPHASRQQSTINITPPTFQQPITHVNESPTHFYPPSRMPLATYISTAYDSYHIPPVVPIAPLPALAQHTSPPVPVPMTSVSFPLDPTRYYLLGQLEYYLSPQNMAQDFFLRQRMDSRGWILIPLIASFNRVRRLTLDINLVRDVLYLSSLVQVCDTWVRMTGWERFVLPDAALSIVEEAPPQPDPNASKDLTGPEPAGHQLDGGHESDALSASLHDGKTADTNHVHGNRDANGEGVEYAEEDDEDEVVFVMGQESGITLSAG